tara:strand:- start:732 stop:1745 length:1014 start_codon:yes stop_codon:yes gene_type:complete
MESKYILDHVNCSSDIHKSNVFDVSAALTINPFITSNDHWGILPHTLLYVAAFPTGIKSGDVASNFRFKLDNGVNNTVCTNWGLLLETYKKVSNNPVVITAIHRDNRIRSIKMNEDGTITIFDDQMNEIQYESKLFSQFLLSSGITKKIILNMRESSKGAGYYSYLSDVLSFLNIINSTFNPDMFIKKRMKFEILTPQDKDDKGGKKLKPFKKENGDEWIPKKDFNYLYFENSSDIEQEHTNDYLFLKEENVPILYRQFLDLISSEDNQTKQLIRKFFSQINTFYRWSDYWINDIDDAITILTIINCYNKSSIPLNVDEKKIRDQFIGISKNVFSFE